MTVYGSKDFRSGVFAAWAHTVAELKTRVDLLAYFIAYSWAYP